MILIYDTETDSLPKDRLPDDHPSQPRLVQLGAALYEDDGTERASIDLTIKPDGWVIPDQVAKIHGITTDIAARSGVPLAVAMATFSNMRRQAHTYVGHNVEFDDKIIRYACAQLGKQLPDMPSLKRECTMRMSSPLMKIPPTERMRAAGFDKYKPPNLGEIHLFLFREALIGAHNAMVDVRACAKVYFRLKAMEREAGGTL